MQSCLAANSTSYFHLLRKSIYSLPFVELDPHPEDDSTMKCRRAPTTSVWYTRNTVYVNNRPNNISQTRIAHAPTRARKNVYHTEAMEQHHPDAVDVNPDQAMEQFQRAGENDSQNQPNERRQHIISDANSDQGMEQEQDHIEHDNRSQPSDEEQSQAGEAPPPPPPPPPSPENLFHRCIQCGMVFRYRLDESGQPYPSCVPCRYQAARDQFMEMEKIESKSAN